jgi:uncharacterized protein (TIGR02246 family)
MRSLKAAAVALALASAAFAPAAYVSDEVSDDMKHFAERYAAAWSSQDPGRVAAFHAEDGSLTINRGAPSVGRAGITEAARSFMTAYPDMVVTLARLERVGDGYRFHWNFVGTHSGPGGTGREVRISGYEDWTMGPDGLIAESHGYYDAADWERQLGRILIAPDPDGA